MTAGPDAVLTARALTRATLARQLLLERHSRTAEDTIGQLVGMQAQAPNAPYVGLWTRLEGFGHDELRVLVDERRVVRTAVMRGTIHLVTAADCGALGPLMRPRLERAFFGTAWYRQNLDGVDLDPILAAGRKVLAERPRTRVELGTALAEHWPDLDPESLAYAVTHLVPVVQVPPRGIWGKSGPATWTTVEAWLGRTRAAKPVTPDSVVLRYLAAYGPATVMDMQNWSGLTRLREVADRLRPELITFRDEHGRELFDLPDAPRPAPDTPAPPRFLPEYDNLLLSHADRSRFITGDRRTPLFPGNGGAMGTLLVDGVYRAMWRIRRSAGAATLRIEPFATMTRTEAAAATREGAALLAFAAGDADRHDVEIAIPD